MYRGAQRQNCRKNCQFCKNEIEVKFEDEVEVEDENVFLIS